jgi:hypothetical protein
MMAKEGKKRCQKLNWLGVTYDIHRKKWKTRFTYNKKERFIGRCASGL